MLLSIKKLVILIFLVLDILILCGYGNDNQLLTNQTKSLQTQSIQKQSDEPQTSDKDAALLPDGQKPTTYEYRMSPPIAGVPLPHVPDPKETIPILPTPETLAPLKESE
jgi:hypothetical protein